MKEVDREGKRLKIHYKGFSDQFDEWKPYDDNKNFPVVRLNISSNHQTFKFCILESLKYISRGIHTEYEGQLQKQNKSADFKSHFTHLNLIVAS